MGTWRVDGSSRPGLLQVSLEGMLTVEEMRAFVAAHNAAVDAFGGADYRVFCDSRALTPLMPECAALVAAAKRYSSAQPSFRGSAVWVSSAVMALQHQRTSHDTGVLETELISDDETRLWAHLAHVYRRVQHDARPGSAP